VVEVATEVVRPLPLLGSCSSVIRGSTQTSSIAARLMRRPSLASYESTRTRLRPLVHVRVREVQIARLFDVLQNVQVVVLYQDAVLKRAGRWFGRQVARDAERVVGVYPRTCSLRYFGWTAHGASRNGAAQRALAEWRMRGARSSQTTPSRSSSFSA
jgi:hypothetical protein